MNTDTNLRAAGFNDEQTECDACGRMELRGTVVIADADGNEVGRYGTTCAGRLLAVKVTRQAAVSTEAARRSRVAAEIGRARRSLAAGDLADVAMRVRDLARFEVLHRADEIEAVAALRMAA